MLKNILLQFTERYNIMYVYCRSENKLSVCIKTKTPNCVPKKKLKLCICVWTPMTRPQIYKSTFLSKFPSHNSWKTVQLSKMLCNNDSQTIWAQSSVTRISWCSVFPQPVESYFPFQRLFDFFLWFLNHKVFDKLIQLKSCVKSALSLFLLL